MTELRKQGSHPCKNKAYSNEPRSKDIDFVRLLEQRGSPPKVIWLTCGNTSEATLQTILVQHLTTALGLFLSGEDLVEVGSL